MVLPYCALLPVHDVNMSVQYVWQSLCGVEATTTALAAAKVTSTQPPQLRWSNSETTHVRALLSVKVGTVKVNVYPAVDESVAGTVVVPDGLSLSHEPDPPLLPVDDRMESEKVLPTVSVGEAGLSQ